MSDLTQHYHEERDLVFPGEGWFCYWKTSASLWPNRLSKWASQTRPLLIPIYWAFHALDERHYDFGGERPETHLAHLATLCHQYQLNFAFLLQLTPIPYWPNGGLPPFLAQSLALDESGMAYGIVDSEGRIQKFYSFFSPKVFEGYNRFVKSLKQHLETLPFNVRVIGFEGGHLEEHQFHSYLSDSSTAFQDMLTKYLELKQEEKDRRQEEFYDTVYSALDPREEDYLSKLEFKETIRDFYRDSLKYYFKESEDGLFSIVFLGGANYHIFHRYEEGLESLPRLCLEFQEAYLHHRIPSALLIPSPVKKGLLEQLIDRLVDKSYLESFSKDSSLYGWESRDGVMTPMAHFLFFDFKNEGERWSDLGLLAWCEKEMPSLYHFYYRKEDLYRDDDLLTHQIFCFRALHLTEELFTPVLSLFMSGATLFIDMQGVDDSVKRRLNTFLIENQLEEESVHFLIHLKYFKLGEGRLMTFQGDELLAFDKEQQLSFWSKMWSVFSFPQIVLEGGKDIFSFWKRGRILSLGGPFEEKRRLLLANPTSEKQLVSLHWGPSFALIHYMDEGSSKLRQKEKMAEVDLGPFSLAILDFGVNYD